jgi:hypothetical protein
MAVMNMLIKLSFGNYWPFYPSNTGYLSNFAIHINDSILESQIFNRQNKTLIQRCFVKFYTVNLLISIWILTKMFEKPWWLL